MYKSSLISKIESRQAVIGIVGLGYVGLPLALRYVECGFKVVGLDNDQFKVDKLIAGESYIEHISSERIIAACQSGLTATSDLQSVSELDVIILCVPTPLNKYREPDISYVVNTADNIGPYLKKGQLLSLESTTYPGTTEEELLPRIEKHGFTVGEDYFLAYSPEREDPGNLAFDTHTIPKICGGHSPDCLEVALAIYGAAINIVHPVSSTRVAEMTKLLENIHRAVNIGLVNEMKIVADKMGINIYEVIDAAKTKPFGFTAYYPGPGLGGHCIPIDPFYLTWKAREYDLHTRFIELAGEINSAMPKWVLNKVIEGLNDYAKPLRGAKAMVLGLAYKKNVDDMRESPSVEILELLSEKGANVEYSDPHIDVFPKMRAHSFDLQSIELTPESIAEYDVVILATDHDEFDYDLIKNHAQLIIDTRGKYAGLNLANVVSA